MASRPLISSRRDVLLDTLLDTPPRKHSLERVISLHECGHAIVGMIRKLGVTEVTLGEQTGETRIVGNGLPLGLLSLFYAGYCAEVEFGIEPREATLGAVIDMDQATSLFPGHNPAIELAKTRSLVSYHRQVINQASMELMAKRKLRRDDLLRLMDDA